MVLQLAPSDPTALAALERLALRAGDAAEVGQVDAQLASASEAFKAAMAKEFDLLSVPAAAGNSAALARQYRNGVLGDIRVQRADGVTTFDFGEWKSEVGSRENPDGTTSFMTIVPGLTGLEFVVGQGDEKALIMRDAQHEYVFDAT